MPGQGLTYKIKTSGHNKDFSFSNFTLFLSVPVFFFHGRPVFTKQYPIPARVHFVTQAILPKNRPAFLTMKFISGLALSVAVLMSAQGVVGTKCGGHPPVHTTTVTPSPISSTEPSSSTASPSASESSTSLPISSSSAVSVSSASSVISSSSSSPIPSSSSSVSSSASSTSSAPPTPSCTGGSVLCGATCIDVKNDPANCGGCGVVCDSGFCVNGACSLNSCTGQTCDTFSACGPGGSCVCASVTGGAGFCADGATPCAGLTDCDTSADCPVGSVCAVGTCCTRNVCIVADTCGGFTNSTEAPARLFRPRGVTWVDATLGHREGYVGVL
ncbi:hypothetical protein V8F06_009412 [Rhypophila decipiens]